MDLHGNATDESTLESLRIVKDFLMRNGGIENFNVTPELIRKCENAHSEYDCHLTEMRKQEQMHLEMKAAEKENEKKTGERHWVVKQWFENGGKYYKRRK